MNINLMQGDCLVELKLISDNSIDSIVTDPPYGISFMGKKWDYQIPSVDIWKECLRVLKPGGHILVACGTKTQHRMAVNIEDAGFEIRDLVAWLYGSGFPKSLNIGKAIKATQSTGGSSPRNLRKARMGKDYKPTGQKDYRKGRMFSSDIENDPTKEEVNNKYEGWGTALKPAMELWTLARKPLEKKHNVAQNVLKHGTGGINIDGCRVGFAANESDSRVGTTTTYNHNKEGYDSTSYHISYDSQVYATNGRFPANVIHDGSDEVLEGFPASSVTGHRTQTSIDNCIESRKVKKGNSQCDVGGNIKEITEYTDSGSTARFFYCTDTEKFPAEKKETHSESSEAAKGKGIFGEFESVETVKHDYGRFPANVIHDGSDEVTELFPNSKSPPIDGPEVSISMDTPVNTGGGNEYFHYGDEGSASRFFYCAKAGKKERNKGLPVVDPEKSPNDHPTVKPVTLMKYLCRMITPVGGTILDPFMGSGSTGIAAKAEGFNFIGIEIDKGYFKIAKKRIG